MADSTRSDSHLPPSTQADGGTRSDAGSNYGDYVPAQRRKPGQADPSRGAELERDSLPADADFGIPPDLKAPQAR